MDFTPEKITALKPNEVFCFGSNEAGAHFGGAALIAFEKFGAMWGVSEGMCDQTYAIPTMDETLKVLPLKKIQKNLETFLLFATDNKDKKFFLTKIGTGIAGYKVEDIASLLVGLEIPNNVILPKEFAI